MIVGVGGQGTLLASKILGNAMMKNGLDVKVSEVHGMSQRGGDVQSNLRLSTETIYSDLIRQGSADLIISMEPMEALRYCQFLNAEGWVVTSSNPFLNIANYPEEEALMTELKGLPHVEAVSIEDLAKQNGIPKSANIVLLGMAARYIGILTPEQLRESITHVFAPKGDAVVEMNLKAFELGMEAVK